MSEIEQNEKKSNKKTIIRITLIIVIIIIIILLLRGCQGTKNSLYGKNEYDSGTFGIGNSFEVSNSIEYKEEKKEDKIGKEDIVETRVLLNNKEEEKEDIIVNDNSGIRSCTHEYVITDSQDATCLQDGFIKYECTKCNKTYTDTVPALGHNYNSHVVEPTCAEQGYTEHVCERCGDSYNDSYTSALGHDYVYDRDEKIDQGNGITVTYTISKCTRCGEEKVELANVLFSFVSNVQEYTVEKDGIYHVEAYGAKSGSGQYGGYVSGEVELHEGDTLYVVVGGQGAGCNGKYGGAGGYNGGGNGGTGAKRSGKQKNGGAGGGGATSIALAYADASEEDKAKLKGTLTVVGKEVFDENGLMVAGGAGGLNYNTGARGDIAGGSNASTSNFGQGNNGRNGQNKSNYGYGNGGGGGGYYGGYSKASGPRESGAGGSSWVNEELVNNEEFIAGGNTEIGNGQALLIFLRDLSEEIEDSLTDNTPILNASAINTPTEDTPNEDDLIDEEPVEDNLADSTSTEDTPAEEILADNTSIDDTPIEENLFDNSPTEDVPAEENLAQNIG